MNGSARMGVMAWQALLAAVLALSCVAGGYERTPERPTEPRIVKLGESFTLGMGEAARVEDAEITVTFQEVSSDSRCPKDVNCIQAGEAVVVLALESAAGKKTLVELAVPPGGSSPAAAFEAFRVTVVELEPQTESTRSIDPSGYVATVRLSSG